MNSLIFLRNFNNYFNRLVKKFDTTGEYIQNYEYFVVDNVNFVPNDGIDTTQILNKIEDWMPDYVIIASPESPGTVQSRWFITEAVRLLNGQYNLTLKRDVVVDYYDNIIEAPCFVEKATIDIDDPFIFNSEGGSYNQIKKSETPLKDYTNSAWLVGYTARDYVLPQEKEGKIKFTYKRSADFVWDSTIFPKPGKTKTIKGVIGAPTLQIDIGLKDYWFWGDDAGKTRWAIISSEEKFTPVADYLANMLKANKDNYFLKFDYKWGFASTSTVSKYFETLEECLNNNYQNIVNAIDTQFPEYLSETVLKEVWNYNGKTVLYEDEYGVVKQYLINVMPIIENATENVVIPKDSALGWEIRNAFPQTSQYYTYTIKGEPFKLNFSYLSYQISLTEYKNGEISVPFTDSHNELMDAPYDMFCIPYENMKIYSNASTVLCENSKEIALASAQGIVSQLTNNTVYDLQLLPYCPIPNLLITDDGGINLNSGLTENEDYNIIKMKKPSEEVEEPVSVIFWAQVSNGTFNIPFNYTVLDPKVENECDLWRLCSPNFNGMFDFSVAKNGGIDFFNVDWTYKPYTPYIHINPNFKKIYGSDFNDSRGLICGGDFSVATAISKFAEYELQNKNYQNIFDRNIQHLDTMYTIGVVENSIKGLNDNAMAGYQGFQSGGKAGAIANIAHHAVNHTTSMVANAFRHKEQKEFLTDQYNFQLGNIKALPMSLTKSSALTYNNKIWPILEYYSATDQEKEALRQKLKYNGMSVMRIGKIKDYLIYLEPQFIQGQLIRLENLSDDSHIAYAIYDEIKKGVFI